MLLPDLSKWMKFSPAIQHFTFHCMVAFTRKLERSIGRMIINSSWMRFIGTDLSQLIKRILRWMYTASFEDQTKMILLKTTELHLQHQFNIHYQLRKVTWTPFTWKEITISRKGWTWWGYYAINQIDTYCCCRQTNSANDCISKYFLSYENIEIDVWIQNTAELIIFNIKVSGNRILTPWLFID